MRKFLFPLVGILLLLLPLCGCGTEEPSLTETADGGNVCTVTILCDTAVASPDCDPDILAILPPDGCILAETQTAFEAGDSVFDVLKAVCREQKIHMEYMETPLYHCAYIEGISNLYEFDCGSLSGWMYAVNDVYPPFGCSRYPVEPGDRITIRYTCALGEDIGGDYASQTADTPDTPAAAS